MKVVVRPYAIPFAMAIAVIGYADYQPTESRWKGWTIQTGEDLSMGTSHTSYPITNLFDGDPSTAWAFSGLQGKAREKKLGLTDYATSDYADPYWITIKPSGRLTLDGLRLMNGYNKSEKAFRDNRRVLVLEVWEGDHDRTPGEKPLKSVRLTDRMGWHDISLPRRRYSDGVTLRLKALSGARTEDVALSELQLLKNGKPVDLTPSNAYIFTSGSDCGCGPEYEILHRDGSRIVRALGGESGSGPAVSDDGRYIGGVEGREKSALLWIVDANAAKIIRRKTIPALTDYIDVAWKRTTVSVQAGPKRLAKLSLR